MKYKDKVYYTDELNDESIDFKISRKKIDGSYRYIHKNIFYRFFAWFTYRIIMIPIIWFWFKIIRRTKYINKKVLKKVKKGGYYIYSNHVEQNSDAFSPTLICLPKKPYIIVNADNVSMPVLGRLTPMWGALPLPDDINATRNFTKALECRIKKNPIVIYPEAHLWQYYTKIRPFSDKSFRYPINMNKPIFTFTTTFVKRKEGKKPRIVTYVDGPFYPDENLDKKERQKALRDVAYNTMVERSKNSNYEYLIYEKRSTND